MCPGPGRPRDDVSYRLRCQQQIQTHVGVVERVGELQDVVLA